MHPASFLGQEMTISGCLGAHQAASEEFVLPAPRQDNSVLGISDEQLPGTPGHCCTLCILQPFKIFKFFF